MVRFKNRYLLVEIMWEKSGGKPGKVPQTSRDEFSNAVKESVRLNFGDFGIGSIYSAFQVKYFNDKTWMCIIRCARDHYRLLWAGITLLTSINSHPCIVRILHVGGTIKNCQERAIEHNKEIMRLLQAKLAAGASVDDLQIDTDILQLPEDQDDAMED